MVRFVRASMKGWQYAVANPDEAAQIVVDSDETGAATIEHQTYMMGEVAKLVDPNDAALDPGDLRADGEGAARPEDHRGRADGCVYDGDY